MNISGAGATFHKSGIVDVNKGSRDVFLKDLQRDLFMSQIRRLSDSLMVIIAPKGATIY